MSQNRIGLVLGVLLILVGGWMIATNQFPAVQEWLEENSSGALYTIGAGLLILLIGLLTGAPGMAVPASIVAGIGGILFYQDMKGDYSSWSYMWALIPGFIGVGHILMGLLGKNTAYNLGLGLRRIVFSAVLFLVFGTFFGGLTILGEYGAPILVIIFGIYLLAHGFRQRREAQV